MPGHNAPVIQVRQQLHVRNREESATPGDARDLAQEAFGILHMLDYFNADCAIPFAIGAGELARFQIDPAEGQLAPVENSAAMRVRFQTKPVVPGSD
jgi:hypothetical protein